MGHGRSAGAGARLPLLISTLAAALFFSVPVSTTFAGALPADLGLTTDATRSGPSIPAGTDATAHLFPLVAGPLPPPTGTITLKVYGPFQAAPASTSCAGTPRSVTTVVVEGFGDYSSSFGPNAAGFYTWTATYSGDANYTQIGPVGCGGARETVQIGKNPAHIFTQVPATGVIGEPITGRAFVSGWLVTGAVAFRLYGPNDPTCAGPPAFTSLNSLVPTSNAPGFGAGLATSSPFVPTQPGTYQWVASYAGDASNTSATTACGDPNGATEVTGCTVSGAGDITGTAGNDVICGSPGPDRITGLGGNDVIFGFGGDDQLVGGPGTDMLLGGDGDDRLTALDAAGGDVANGGAHVLGDLCVADSADSVLGCETRSIPTTTTSP